MGSEIVGGTFVAVLAGHDQFLTEPLENLELVGEGHVPQDVEEGRNFTETAELTLEPKAKADKQKADERFENNRGHLTGLDVTIGITLFHHFLWTSASDTIPQTTGNQTLTILLACP